MSTYTTNRIYKLLATVGIVLGLAVLAPASAEQYSKLGNSRGESAETRSGKPSPRSMPQTREHVLLAQPEANAAAASASSTAPLQGSEKNSADSRLPAGPSSKGKLKAKDPKRSRVCIPINTPGGGMKITCTDCINHGGPHESCVDTTCTIPAPGPQGLSNPPGICLTGQPYSPN